MIMSISLTDIFQHMPSHTVIYCKDESIFEKIRLGIKILFSKDLIEAEATLQHFHDLSDSDIETFKFNLFISNRFSCVVDTKDHLVQVGYNIVYPIFDDKDGTLYGFSFHDIDHKKYSIMFEFVNKMINTTYKYNIIRLESVESFLIIRDIIRDMSKGFNKLIISYKKLKTICDVIEHFGYCDIHLDIIETDSDIVDVSVNNVYNIEDNDRSSYKIYRVIV